MSKVNKKEVGAIISFKDIHLIEFKLNENNFDSTNPNEFKFQINVECHADKIKHLLLLTLKIEISNDKPENILGYISMRCIYEITNFDDVITFNKNGIVEIPDNLIVIINSISLSTARGVMYSTFKGTRLHGAILPILDPKVIR